ncbi:MAG: tetratricopeptide repeat protein, partial [Thermoanaerobaculaceae bacterium]|nr:tetratricopeptide repeat protein [Thermoanaerobaculaceae bacterium]
MKGKKKNKNSVKTSIFFYLLLAIISFAPYFSLLNADFVNWDDDIYVTQNAKVTKGLTLDNVKWAFSTTYFGFYYPITWISHMIDVSIYGVNPKGHHFTNILIHIFNTILLFNFLWKGGIDEVKSFIISALFAVHPLNVESVGWISERKNLLAAFFFLLGMNLYVKYVRTPSYKNLAMVFTAYLFGLMSKSIVVTFPVALYLIDIWPLKSIEVSFSYIKENFWKLLKEKIFFLLPVPVFSYLTIVAQKEVSALSTFDSYPLDQRIAGAILAYGRYIYQFVFPLKLTAFYPHLRNNYSIVLLLINILLLLAAGYFFVKLLKKEPLYLIGYFWFLSNLLPVIGIIQVGEQGSADRYMYIPMIGLLWIFVFALFTILSKTKIIKTVHIFVIFFIIFVFWGVKTHYQCKVWMNSDNLFANMIYESPNPAQGYINAGLQLKMKKEYLKAVELYQKAIEADPLKASAYNNLGSALYELKDIKEANKAFKKAVELNPNHPVMVYNL